MSSTPAASSGGGSRLDRSTSLKNSIHDFAFDVRYVQSGVYDESHEREVRHSPTFFSSTKLKIPIFRKTATGYSSGTTHSTLDWEVKRIGRDVEMSISGSYGVTRYIITSPRMGKATITDVDSHCTLMYEFDVFGESPDKRLDVGYVLWSLYMKRLPAAVPAPGVASWVSVPLDEPVAGLRSLARYGLNRYRYHNGSRSSYTASSGYIFSDARSAKLAIPNHETHFVQQCRFDITTRPTVECVLEIARFCFQVKPSPRLGLHFREQISSLMSSPKYLYKNGLISQSWIVDTVGYVAESVSVSNEEFLVNSHS